jgi:hypothetical protein
MGRRGVVHRPVDPAHHAPVGQLGQEPVDRVVEAQHAFLEQDHGGHRGDRLGHRRDAKDAVVPHREAAPHGHGADDVDMGLAPAAEHRDEAGRRAPLDVARHDLVQAVHPVLDQRCAHHGGL